MHNESGKPVPFADIADLAEDKRIELIGHRAMEHKEKVAFIVDSDAIEKGKADRYVRKLQERFPGIVIIERGDGPVAGTVFVKVGPPVN